MNATPQQALTQLAEASRLASLPAAAHESCEQCRQILVAALSELDLLRNVVQRKSDGNSANCDPA